MIFQDANVKQKKKDNIFLILRKSLTLLNIYILCVIYLINLNTSSFAKTPETGYIPPESAFPKIIISAF